MTNLRLSMPEQMTRREAIGRAAFAGAGIASALMGGPAKLAAQAGLPAVIPPAGDDRFPKVPSWKTELRKLAPNVYAYVQRGGPGLSSAGISNAGLIVGDDHLMAIDGLGAPLQTKAFIAAAGQATGGKPFRRLINTHHHADHVSGNQYFLPAEILGHPYCRQEVLKSVATTPAYV